MWVVTLSQQLYNTGHLLRVAEEHESEGHHGNSSHIIISIADSNVQQSSNGLVVGGAAVCEGNGEDTTVA